MLNNLLKSNFIILLAHLDDEFALIPLIRNLSTIENPNFKIIYCAERNNKRNRERRKENSKFLKFFKIDSKQIIYLNDFFPVNDLNQLKDSKNIYKFLKCEFSKNKFDFLLSLDFEGGNPDHDSLALITEKFCKNHKIGSLYFPAYNFSGNILFPLNVLSPKKEEKIYYEVYKTKKKDWLDLIKITFIYKTEFSAFIKLLPFFIFKIIFSNKFYFRKSLRPIRINWQETISKIIYRADIKTLKENIDNIDFQRA